MARRLWTINLAQLQLVELLLQLVVPAGRLFLAVARHMAATAVPTRARGTPRRRLTLVLVRITIVIV